MKQSHLNFWNLIRHIVITKEFLDISSLIVSKFGDDVPEEAQTLHSTLINDYKTALQQLPIHKAIIEPLVDAGADKPYSDNWDNYYQSVKGELQLDFDPFEELEKWNS